MDVYDFDDYRDYLKDFIALSPQKGYGKHAELAQACGMNPATVTLVLKKERDFTLDQAFEVGNYLGLNSFELEYFFTSVNLQRAGKTSLRNFFKKKLQELKRQATDLQKRMGESKDLDENSKAQFYSNWYYSAIRLSTSLPHVSSIDDISKKLNLSRSTVKTVVEFLLQNGLIKWEDRNLEMAIQSTHLSSTSPLVSRHHQNWRLRAFQKMDHLEEDELFFTSPVSISKADIQQVRKVLVKSIDEVFKVVDPSPEEELACLNIDWFKL